MIITDGKMKQRYICYRRNVSVRRIRSAWHNVRISLYKEYLISEQFFVLQCEDRVQSGRVQNIFNMVISGMKI